MAAAEAGVSDASTLIGGAEAWRWNAWLVWKCSINNPVTKEVEGTELFCSFPSTQFRPM